MTLTLGKKKCREGLNVCMNYEFNLSHHVSVVAKRVHAAETAAETAAAAHEGDDNTPSGRGVKTTSVVISRMRAKSLLSPLAVHYHSNVTNYGNDYTHSN